MTFPRATACWILVGALAAAAPLRAGGSLCPPPPNPSGCTLEFDRSTLTELDADLDGLPDNRGSTGNFCAGNSPADCSGVLGSEVGFTLIVSDPARQSVTCTTQGVDIWIMTADCGQCLSIGTGSVTLAAGTTSQSDLRVVVSDVNADICPCGGSVTCTFSVEAECSDGADGDGDGLIDAADPDCCLDDDGDGFCGAADCDDANPLVHAPPAPVTDLRVSEPFPDTRLTWSVAPGEWVDVVSGPLDDLRETGSFSLATCLIEDELNPPAADTRPDPQPGEAYYYVARTQNTCGGRSYGREELDALAPCGFDRTCTRCTLCDLRDPTPVCGDEQCVATYGTPPTLCSGPTGRGGTGEGCSTANECLPGYACASGVCRAWCRVPLGFLDCPSSFCVGLTPPVTIDGTEYGVCL